MSVDSSYPLRGRSRPRLESPDTSSPRVWKVGALTYTTGGLVVLFSWLLWGDFAWSMKERSVAPVVQLLLKKLQTTDTMTGVLLGSIPAAIGIVLGPVISYRSDRHRGRWGRRIPYLIVTTPVAAIAMVGLAFCPAMGALLARTLGSDVLSLHTSTLLVFGTFWTLFEIATIAANAVFGGLINDVVPAEVLGRFYGMFRALSLIAGMIFNFWLLGKAETHFAWVFVGVGVLYGAGFMMMCLKVKEGDYPPPPSLEPHRAGSFAAAVRSYCSDCFTNPYYLWVFVFMTVSTVAFVPVNLFSVYFATSVSMNMDRYGDYLALTYLISLSIAYFLGSLADRFHPMRVGLITLLCYAGATLWGGLYADTAARFAVALVLHGVLSGMFFTTTASLAQRLFPRGKFAQFCSAAGVINAVASMAIGPAVGRLLDTSGHVYRYTYLASCVITVVALLTGLVVYRGFTKFGGPDRYVAPERS